MDGINKLYHDYFKLWKEVYGCEISSGTEIQRKVNVTWDKIKVQVKAGNMALYNEEYNKLKHANDKRKAKFSITSFFARANSKPSTTSSTSQSTPSSSSTELQQHPSCVQEDDSLCIEEPAEEITTKPPPPSTTSHPLRSTPSQDKISSEINDLRATILHLEAAPIRTKDITDEVKSKKKTLKEKEKKLRALKLSSERSKTLYLKKKQILKRAAAGHLQDDPEAQRFLCFFYIYLLFLDLSNVI